MGSTSRGSKKKKLNLSLIRNVGLKDLEGRTGQDWCPFDELLEVSCVAREKFYKFKRLMKEKALRKPMLDVPKEEPKDVQGKLMNSAIQAQRNSDRKYGEEDDQDWVLESENKEVEDIEADTENNNRLSMPLRQVRADFLTEGEKVDLKAREKIKTILIDSRLKKGDIVLKQWNMKKDSGNTSSSYVLMTTWNQVCKDNDLKINDLVQVWSFRVGQQQGCDGSSGSNKGKICFALVLDIVTTQACDEDVDCVHVMHEKANSRRLQYWELSQQLEEGKSFG
uniref:TF-B3 domain-containing protein n=1 Tax=Fagus sylvatica TaxID=28930 RepID=A0A2N9EKX9_FAGSY